MTHNLMEYPIEIFDNHIFLIDKDKRFLIDTGSPSTISNGSSIEIFNEVYETEETYHGANIEKLSDFVGCSFDALIGHNILKNYIFQIDRSADMDEEAVYLADVEGIDLDSGFRKWDSLPENREMWGIGEDFITADFRGIPTIDISVNKKTIASWLDTGAKISYINSNYVKGLTPVDYKKDFFPGYGEFEAPIYSLPMIFSKKEILFEFGVLPDLLERSMLSGRTKAIVGADIFYYYVLTFHCKENKIYIEIPPF
tara:strand:+ start:180 stop:944 length:765 start_codon:yes stop_codon:yes gene_type:complete